MAEDKKDTAQDGLTKDQVEHLKKWIDQKAVDMTCPICTKATWIPGSLILTPPARGKGKSMVIGGRTYPMVPIICTNCGYMHFFNALIVGLEEPDIKPGEQDA